MAEAIFFFISALRFVLSESFGFYSLSFSDFLNTICHSLYLFMLLCLRHQLIYLFSNLNDFLALALWLVTKYDALKALKFVNESLLKASLSHWRAAFRILCRVGFICAWESHENPSLYKQYLLISSDIVCEMLVQIDPLPGIILEPGGRGSLLCSDPS